MRTETKRVLYIFLTLCIILTFALFLSWVADGTGSGDESFVVSDTTSAELSDNASHVIAEQSDVTGEQSDYSTEESLNSEESIDISEEVSDVSEQSDEHVISDNFPVSYIENNVTAGYIAVYNVTEGKYIYGKNENEKCYPASLTKLVTALLAVKHLDTNEIITVGDEIRRIGKGSSVAYLVVGYRMKLEVLLDAMMLPSGNDAAYTAAVAVGRKILGDKNASIDAALECFYKAANEYVRSIGCTGTNIACPDGYHDDNHYTTAWDYVLISKEAMKNPLIMKVVQKKVAYDTLADGTQVKYENTNLLLDYAYVTGLKTGTTNEAGYCVAVSAKSNGVEIIVVVMKSTSAAARYEDAKKLISAAYGWF